ncbi:Type IV fimbrial assembly, ATPase PilB [Cronobacter universalis NCTC 9529]|nr:Type IV fimbrial assembly, ATPase PilB [Cronobacter universalis NCTC 9529]
MPLDYLHTLCQRYNALVLNIDDATVHIAVAGEPSNELMDALRFSTHRHIDIECWSAERLEKERQLAADTLRPAAQDESASVVELIDKTLQQALQRRASDIHFEPAEAYYQIRFRIDGVLHALPPLPATLGSRADSTS